MEYRVGCLADLISGVKGSSSKSPKIYLQPVEDNSNVAEKKRKRASANFIPVIGPAESSIVSSEESKTKARKTGDFKSRKKSNLPSDELAERRIHFPKNSINDTDSFNGKPKHSLDKAAEARTVFVKNLPINIEKKKIMKIFGKFGEVESIRYRCAPRADTRIPKKVAVIKKKFHPDRTNISAFVRFKSGDGAQKALIEASGMELGSHHILVTKALKEEVYNQKRAVFVGNIPFGAEEEDMWALFSQCGDIRDIRIVRDSETGVGKGFGYVNFKSNDAVELALTLDGELLKGRNIRVKRAVDQPKNRIPVSNKQQNHSQQEGKPVGKRLKVKVKGNKAKEIALSNKLGPKALKFNDNLNKKKWRKKEEGVVGNKKRDAERLPYQGMTGEEKKGKRKKVNKEERKKKTIAKKLGFA